MALHHANLLISTLLFAVCSACGVAESEDTDASEGAVSSESEAKAKPFPEAELAKASGCFACHKVEGKLVGPSFHEIAHRAMPNHPEADAPDSLVDRVATNIREGSSRRWGFIAMPPNREVNADDAKRLARAILESGPGSCGARCEL